MGRGCDIVSILSQVYQRGAINISAFMIAPLYVKLEIVIARIFIADSTTPKLLNLYMHILVCM